MKYDLVFLGHSRTGTRSLFGMLAKHYQIQKSRTKEPLNPFKLDSIFRDPKMYLRNFKVKRYTKVLLDGTPEVYQHQQALMRSIKALEWVSNLKIIYTIRNPIDKIKSYIKLLKIFQIHTGSEWASEWFGDMVLNESVFLDRVRLTLDSEHLKSATSIADQVYVGNLYQINSKELFRFLGVEEHTFKLEQKNQFPHWSSFDKMVEEFLEEHKDILKEMFLTDLTNIKTEYDVNIDDIIKDVELW